MTKEKPARYIYGKYSDGQREQTNRYNKTHYDTILVRLKKGEKAAILRAAEEKGESLNRFCMNAIARRINESDES
ncbi:MAG: hypothetical protein NC084_11250 [Bacteroides sp.]|nr:hypothetical protein [Eubacterium sp.]MCM1419509.1 hypothetical protein [Roseburia sp.]MCM1463266.1 hypothetical protein [Bacteroides sp.]